MKIYQLKRIKNGLCINNDFECKLNLSLYPLKCTVNIPKNEENYVVVTKELNEDLVNVTVIYGPNRGSKYSSIDRSMLCVPNILPCYRNNADKWLDCMLMIDNGRMPDSVEEMINNALGDRSKYKGLSTLGTTDSILSTKILQEVLEPYLGPFGLILMLNMIQSRVLKNK